MDLVRDFRFALRGLTRRPLVWTVAVLTLSLGLASVTVLFAVTDSVILQPIGDDDSRLVRIWKNDVDRGGGILFPISYPEYLIWKDKTAAFDALAAINYADGSTTTMLVDDEPITANVVSASAELLDVVGATPAYGASSRPATTSRAPPTWPSSATDSGDAPAVTRITSGSACVIPAASRSRLSGCCNRARPTRSTPTFGSPWFPRSPAATRRGPTA